MKRLLIISSLLLSMSLFAQTATTIASPSDPNAETDADAGLSRSGKEIQVPKPTPDQLIVTRIQKILEVTGWFSNLSVNCREGVVTISGSVAEQAHADWAEHLAHDTEGVVAVLNKIEVKTGKWLNLDPAKAQAKNILKKSIAFSPYLLLSIIIFVAFLFLARFCSRIGRRAAQQRLRNPLMIEIVSKLFALPAFLAGAYIVLKISGLTGIAITILGGTGAVGLIVGFAMKNILENYFSGVMLSLRNPYNAGDIVEIGGRQGVVQQLTTRGTVLVDFDGNHIIIPNTTIYGNVIVNMTANPSLRVKFKMNVDNDHSIEQARLAVLQVLRSTPGVLREPEPLVLIDEFAATSIALIVYFWIDSKESSVLKMKSLVMEKVNMRLGRTPDGKVPQNTKTESVDLLKEAQKGRSLDIGDRLV